VTGSAAFLLDFNTSLAERLPWAGLLVATATFVLLFLMTGSVLVPAKALVMNVLSLGASFGALVLVFQEGWLAGPLGVEPADGLQTWVPVLVFVFAVRPVDGLRGLPALAHQGARRRGPRQRHRRRARAAAQRPDHHLRRAAARHRLRRLRRRRHGRDHQLGLAMAVAIAVDATLVRCLLVPATMTLLGDRELVGPAPLRRLPERFGVSSTARWPSPRPQPEEPPPAPPATRSALRRSCSRARPPRSAAAAAATSP
jgi:RND superfamily putative drug exporter